MLGKSAASWLLWVFVCSVPALGETEAELREMYLRLEADQSSLANEWQRLQSAGSIRDSLGEIQRQLDRLSAEEKLALQDAKTLKQLPETLQERLTPILAQYGELDGRLSRFQQAYDAFNDGKIDYYAGRYRLVARAVADQLRETGSPELVQRLDAILQSMDRHFEEHREMRADPLAGKNRRRLYPFRNLMKDFKRFMDEASWSRMTLKEKAKRVGGKALERTRMALWALAQLPTMANLYLKLYRGAPFVEPLEKLADRFERSQGLGHEVVGRVNIGSPRGPREINVYAASHMNAVLDAASLAHLKIPEAAIFTTDDTWKRVGLSKQMDSHPEFILVSQGKNPLAKIEQLYKDGKIKNVIIHPEANQPSGVAYETRKPNDNFARATLGLLRRKGFRINVIPVTTPTHFRALNSPTGSAESSKLVAEVHPPISADLVNLILAAGDAEGLSRLIRGHWLESLSRYGPEGRFLGMPTLDQTTERVDMAVIPPNCGEITRQLSP